MTSFIYNTNNLLDDYLSIQGSTTQFLADVAQAPVQVSIVKQQLRSQYLYRESLLHIGDDSNPILYARCLFYLQCLSSQQIHQLLNSQIPVGQILGIGLIQKRNQQLTRSQNPLFANRLLIEDQCCERSFDLYVGEIKVANLSEVVSQQSLARLTCQQSTMINQVVG